MFKATPWMIAYVWMVSCCLASDPSPEDEAFFETKIRPLLANSCIECHGPNKSSGGLRLDTSEAMFKGGESGEVINRGQPESSLLLRAVRRDADSSLKMPPDESLDQQAIADLTRWIETGAKWPQSHPEPILSDRKHWAFQPLQTASIPSSVSSFDNPVDHFIDASRRVHDLQPVGLASRSTLIRRAYFDLIGLPPSPAEVEAFLADPSPLAFANVVDQLLASPQYGERWGRHWLDLVRYADTAGDNADYPIPQAYLYRDYVIDAFNEDLPYDRFLHEQLAGDILAKQASESDYARLVIATGFIAQSKRIGTRELEDMHLIIEDTLTTLGPAIMGLSLRCARCHDHKFEPISMEDYYALYGFFASTQYPFAGAEEVRKQTKFAPLLPLDRINNLTQVRTAELATLKSEIEQLESSQETADQARATRLAAAKERLKSLEKADPLEGVPTAYAVSELPPVDVTIQPAGDPHAKPGKLVRRGIPKILDAQPLSIADGSSGRLELARWLTTNARHLTARVFVNRVWQHHFGKPLVPTPSDFGLRGSPPTHPDLLDWLAQQFIDSGWSIKALHRMIMLSQTYQLSSEWDESSAAIDSGNKWYWRFDRRRMDAESLRDSVLQLSGQLDLSRPGPHPFPEPSKWRYTAHHQFNDVCYPSNHRSVYLMVQRLHAHPYLSLFNGPDPSLSTPSRDSSTVPLQSLYLLNNSFLHEHAEQFARRLILETGDVQARLESAALRAYSRPATEKELERWSQFLSEYEQVLEQEGVAAPSRELTTWSALARTLLVSNGFFFVD